MVRRFFMQLGLFTTTDRRALSREEVKSCPFLYKIWTDLSYDFFPGEEDLLNYRVIWSRRRQKRTLATCHFDSKRIIVAKELNFPQFYCWLPPLLYHEMCHAVIGVKPPRRNGKNCWHGKEFRTLEAQHPEMANFNRWVKEGGWAYAVRSERAKASHYSRRKAIAESENRVSSG